MGVIDRVMVGKYLVSLIFIIFTLSIYCISPAYDSNGNGSDDLADVIFSIQEYRLKETIHTLQILSGMHPPSELYFTRSDNGHLVTDLTGGLMWQDYALTFGTETEGMEYCNLSVLDDYQDWRLPTFQELQEFFKAVNGDYSFDLNFWGTFPNCTASVAIGGYVRTPRGSEVYGGEVGDSINFSGGAAVRCVRDN